MTFSVQIKRGTAPFLVLIGLLPSLSSCNNGNFHPDITSTPVATPIVVSSTPYPSVSPSSQTTTLNAQEKRELALAQVAKAIEKTRADFPGDTSVFFIDIESDLELNYDGEKSFESASLMKLIVIAELYRRAQVGEVELDTRLTLESQHLVGGSGDLKEIEPGMSFEVRDLAERMISQSDNTATQMLTDFLTKETLNANLKNFGLTGTSIQRDIYDFSVIQDGKDNVTTSRDIATLLEQIAREELAGSQEIHSILERQERNDMIGSGMPDNLRVAHKTGELNGILHDVGIVYASEGPYVLALLSDKVTDKERAVKAWRDLSLEILEIYQDKSLPLVPSPLN